MPLSVLNGPRERRMSRHDLVAKWKQSLPPSILAGAFVGFTLSTLVAMGQPAQYSAALNAVQPFIGKWQGTSEGQPGTGTLTREYRAVLQDRFIEETNRSVYPPQQKNPKGEVHEHRGFFSFDSARKTVVFRQFHVEGFVNQYVLESPTKPGVLVFVSEAIENIPKGYRARETYTFISASEFEEVFEIAEPGKDFELYSRARLKRVP